MRTRFEGIHIRDLLAEYLKANYGEKPVLVIFGTDVDADDADVWAEWLKIQETMTSYNRQIPDAMKCDNFIIMEMCEYMAIAIINQHQKSSIRLELWANGLCQHENR